MSGGGRPWLDASLPSEERARLLLAEMDLREKIAQLGAVWSTSLADDGGFSPERARSHLAHGIGEITRIGSSTGLRPRESAAFHNRIQRFLLEETRLRIPALVHEEATAGYAARDADQLPQALGLAATFDPARIEAAAALIREQMRAVGARHALAPVLDIARDPRWGRTEETYGEDPYLASRLGVAFVRGLQGGDLRRGVAATGKHFLGYGFSEGGHNHKPAHLGPRELREVVARPFLAAIQEAGLAAVMNAYNEVDGLPCGGSQEILGALLREELGFDGLVVADYFTTRLLIRAHRVAEDPGEAAQMALEAGIDLELPVLDCYRELAARVRDGRLPEATLDAAVLRVLRLKFALGLFEDPLVDEGRAGEAYQTPRARQLARELAERSVVLLQNREGVLPLSRALRRLAVIGPAADDVRLLQGDYHYPAHLEIQLRARHGPGSEILPASGESRLAGGFFFPPTVTPLAGLRELLGGDAGIRYAKGCEVVGGDDSGIAEAVAAAREAEVALLFVGGRSGLVEGCTTGEFRDASDLSLPGHQEALVRAVVGTGTPTVAVVVSGRVHALAWLAEHAAALLHAFVPGEEGGRALARVLFGEIGPSGRLPVSLPRSVGQIPVYHARHWESDAAGGLAPGRYVDGPADPLFPFGHGLTYSRFDYRQLEVEPEEAPCGCEVRVALEIENVGAWPAEEVVQLYLQDPVATVVRPVRQLAGFARIALDPGHAARVEFTLDPSQLALFDRGMRFRVEPGEFRVFVGRSSEDLPLAGRFRCLEPGQGLDPRRVLPTRVRVQPLP